METHLRMRAYSTGHRLTFSKQMVANMCFVMFFCSDVLLFLVNRLFRFYGIQEYAWIFTCILIYFPLLFMPFAAGKRRHTLDFFVLWSIAAAAFIVTFKVHPEYEAWLTHPLYGVVNYIFRPDRALYAYFMVRISNDPKQILKSLKFASYILVMYGAYKFQNAMQVGYWLRMTASGMIGSSYSMEFGYDMLLPSIVFMYYAIKEKKLLNLTLCITCIFMILIAGSRAPLLWCIVFFTAMLVRRFAASKVKAFWGLTIPIFVLIYLNLEKIFTPVLFFLLDRGISARSLTMLLSGSINSDNGRGAIYDMAIDMIRNSSFLGYGLYGDRNVIGDYYFWGYPHNFFLEILITFGIACGSGLIIFLLYHVVRTLVKCKDDDWMELFLIFLICSLKLLVSYSYWYAPEFWAVIAVVYCWSQQQKISNKNERMKQINV